MLPRIRTIAILMLLAGLCLGIFASRALRAMGGPEKTGPVTGGQPQVEQRVEYFQRYYRLTPQQTDAIRRELYQHDRLVRDKLWELRKVHADWFETRREALETRVREILREATEDR